MNALLDLQEESGFEENIIKRNKMALELHVTCQIDT